MKTQLCLLAAGAGQRFADAGYEVPKPFILVDGKLPMWMFVSSMMHISPGATDLYGALPPWASGKTLFGSGAFKNFVALETITRGPVESALNAVNLWPEINPLRPVLFYDCDSYIRQPMNETAAYFERHNTTCGLVGFYGESSPDDTNKAKLFTSADRTRLLRAWERQPDLPIGGDVLGACGIYWFRSLSEFETLAAQYLEKLPEGREATFVDMFSKTAAQEVAVLPVPRTSFHCLGTPEELRAYQGLLPDVEA